MSSAEINDIRSQNKNLKRQNQRLREQLQELKERQSGLLKKLQIWNQISDNSNASCLDREKESLLLMQNEHIKAQLINIISEKQQLNRLNEAYQEKINDLKYNNQQLKGFNERNAQLHARELQMLKKEAISIQKYKNLEEKEKKLIRDKQILEKKLDQVGDMVKQMEEFYVAKINELSETLTDRQNQLNQTISQSESSKNKNIMIYQSQIKQLNQRWEERYEKMKQDYEQEIIELRGKIKVLIYKLEGVQQSKTPKISLTSQSQSETLQTKTIQSNTSMESFRFTPNNSVATSLKESVGRRNTSGVKTPNKYANQKGKSYCPLFDKTNR